MRLKENKNKLILMSFILMFFLIISNTKIYAASDLNDIDSNNLIVYEIKDFSDIKKIIYNGMKNRETTITIKHKEPIDDALLEIFSYGSLYKLEAEDNTINNKSIIGIDYMYNVLKNILYETTITYYKNEEDYSTTIKLNYNETKEQTDYVLEITKKIIRENPKVLTYSDYEKHMWVYDYIIKNVDYDYNLENTTPYKAIYDGKVVCSGFAGLYYLMTRELGLSTKIVYGTGEGIPHAWNIVKMEDDIWYYVDSTWGQSYQDKTFLLKAKDNLNSHVLDDGFEKLNINFSVVDYVETKKTYSNIPLETFGVSFNNYKGVIKVNNKYNLNLISEISEENNQLNVNSYIKNNKIATIDENGQITGKQVGKTFIVIEYGDNLLELPLEVKANINNKLKNIKLKPKQIKDISKAVIISNNGYKDLTFKTSDKKTVSVTSTGKIKGIKKGKATIKIYNKNTGKYITKLTVTVK